MATAVQDAAIETRHVLMHGYGNTYADWSGGPQPFFSYSRFAEGAFLATRENMLDASMERYRSHMLQRVEEGVYRLPRTKRYLRDADAQMLRQAILDGIRKEKETTKLWTAADDIEGYMGHDVLTGDVPSRSSGRRSDTLSRWHVTIKSPIFRSREERYGIDYSALHCGCQEFDWGIAKNVAMVCVHMTAEIKTAWDEQADPTIPEESRRINYFKAEGPVYLPYNIGILDAIDVGFRRYVVGQDSKDIDMTELEREKNYDPIFLLYIQRDRFVFEAVRHSNKKLPKDPQKRRVAEEKAKADDRLSRDLYWSLHNAGFRKTGLYAVELKGTSYESLCESYVRDSEVVRPAFNTKFPPFFVHWRLSDKKNIFGQQDKTNPFEIAGDIVTDIDDRTRYVGEKRIIIPGTRTQMPEGVESVAMPPVYRRDYMARIPQEKFRALGIALF